VGGERQFSYSGGAGTQELQVIVALWVGGCSWGSAAHAGPAMGLS
jgi:hypothetical protein